MLLFSLLKSAKVVEGPETRVWRYPQNVSRIIVFGSFLMYPLIIIFGVYMVIHGHLSPGGGFQGGAVMASGTALLLISALITKNLQKTNKIFSIFESLGLSIFIGLGFAGIGAAFLNNFLVNGSMDFFGKVIEFGPNPGYLNSGGILPLLSLAVGIEVFCGLSIILISLYYVSPYTGNDKKKEEQI
ncbi:MAG: sodium:proton antiporter [bacterium]|nr:sodium:proton antiporter [bacterium]